MSATACHESARLLHHAGALMESRIGQRLGPVAVVGPLEVKVVQG